MLMLLDVVKQAMFHPRLANCKMRKDMLFWMLTVVLRVVPVMGVSTGLHVVPSE